MSTETIFTDSQQRAFDLIVKTEQKYFVIKGSAGTGKSYLTNSIIRFFQDTHQKVLIAAPTGVAAIKINGMTVHALINLLRHEPFLLPDLIVIDEVSMCRADLLDELFSALGRRIENLKLVLVGDLAQLPPVVNKKDDEYKYLEANYFTPYFFSSNGYHKISKTEGWCSIELVEKIRQSDPLYVKILDAVRGGKSHPDIGFALDTLNTMCIAQEPNGVFITPTNRAAEEINRFMLEQLKEEEFQYKCVASGAIKPHEYPADELLRVKFGARVMVIRNIYEDKFLELVNGDTGTVRECTPNSIFVYIDRTKKEHEIAMTSWDKEKITFDEDKNELVREKIASFSQIPLTLAWAITIHKSQGATLCEYTIDLSNPLFAEGQLYVALSRGTVLSGLKIIGEARLSDVMIDPRVAAFLKDGETGVGIKPGSRFEKAAQRVSEPSKFFS